MASSMRPRWDSLTVSRVSWCGPRGSSRCVTDGTDGNTCVYDTREHTCFSLGDEMMATIATEQQPRDLPASYKIARIGLAAATALISINLWTGAPLLAIWVGSQVQGGTGLTMKAVGAVIGVLAITVSILVFLLIKTEAAYKFFSGEPVQKKRTSPWMRSLRDERPELAEKRPLSGVEKTMIAAVVVAVIAFETWFFFFAGSSIG